MNDVTESQELEYELAELDKQEPRPPIQRLVVLQEPTTEALLDKLANTSPCAAVLSDEGGNYLGGYAMKADSRTRNMATINKAWDGRSLSSERKSVASVGVKSPRMTIGLAIQRAAMDAHRSDSGGLDRGIGYAARFIVSDPPSTQGTRMFREGGNMPKLTQFARRLRELLDIPLTTDNGVLQPPLLCLDGDSKAAWVKFHDDVERELGLGGEMADAKDAAAKAADNAARVAALLHVFEHGPNGVIALGSMSAAIQLMTWHLFEFRRYYCELAPTPEMVNAQKLEAWLLRRMADTDTKQVKSKDVLQLGPGCVRHRKELDAALAVLEKAKRARRVKVGADGRRTEAIEINPALAEAA